MSNFFKQYTFDKHWKDFLQSTFGEGDTKVSTGGRREKFPVNGIGFYRRDAILPKRPTKADKLMAGTIGRFVYPDIVDNILRAVPRGQGNKYDIAFNVIQQGEFVINQITNLLALHRGADHFDQDNLIEHAKDRLERDLNFEHKDHSDWVGRHYPTISRVIENMTDSPQWVMTGKWLKEKPGSKHLEDASGTGHNDAVDDIREHNSRFKFSNAVYRDVLFELADKDTGNRFAQGIVSNLFIYESLHHLPQYGEKHLIHKAEDVAFAIVQSAIWIANYLAITAVKTKPRGGYSHLSMPAHSINAPEIAEQMKKQAVEDETKAHNTIDTAGIISSEDKAKISDIASDVRIRGEYDEEKEGNYLADYNSMQDDPYNEEEIVEFIEEHDEWASTGERPRQSGGFGYLQEPVTERECDYWTERDLTIENIESVAEGDHEDQAIDNIGMPTHNAWQLQYGNMNVFKQLTSNKPEIVVLLDNSISTDGWLAGRYNSNDWTKNVTINTVEWSIAMSIKQSYSDVEIHPYSGGHQNYIGISPIEVGKSIPGFRKGGTPTKEALLWARKKYYDRLDRLNIVLITDDEQHRNTGHLCRYLRDTDGMRLGIISVGQTVTDTYKTLGDLAVKIENQEDMPKIEQLLNIITTEG